jgi:hypothetical protein
MTTVKVLHDAFLGSLPMRATSMENLWSPGLQDGYETTASLPKHGAILAHNDYGRTLHGVPGYNACLQ